MVDANLFWQVSPSPSCRGCAIHNVLTNCVAGLKPNFDLLESTFNDSSWNLNNMWDYFVRIERNLILTTAFMVGWVLSAVLSPLQTVQVSVHRPQV
jgi:hypothetical protein